ncbi:MAG: pyridine nucleotide-disulfide oxidoreductase, partial [Candidatus Brockarchaeota archaeon]|nr:pyridine nucleotide-disulfide oxidoreductase [Candidatus Brockarchaeota archaeon]
YVDDAVETACIAARGVEKYLNGELKTSPVRLVPSGKVRMIVPQRVEWVDEEDVVAFLRPAVEKSNARIEVRNSEGRVLGGFFRRYVRPSTLERIEVSRSLFSGQREVTVDIADS